MSFDRQTGHSVGSPSVVAATPTVGQGPPESNTTPVQALTTTQYWARQIPERYVVPFCGATSGAVSGLVSCPLDVIKTKLQAQGGFQIPRQDVKLTTAAYRGIYGTAATIWKEDGLRGIRFLADVYASLGAGACSTMTTNPIWVIKTRLMAQSNTRSTINHSRPPWQYRNTLDAARKMYRAEGLLSFYSGLTPALLGLTHVAIQFPLYEVLKARFTGIGVGEQATEEDRSHHFYGLALAVFLSKVCASTATYPHEVVRTRLQTQQRSSSDAFSTNTASRRGSGDHGRPPGRSTSIQPLANLPYRGTIQTCKAILLEEGWRGFYAGLGTNLIRAVPAAMTTILTFEYLKKTIAKLQREEQDGLDISG
ncbi:MAG: hypothetical protein Q9170_003349 [Blastenia crenularia]